MGRVKAALDSFTGRCLSSFPDLLVLIVHLCKTDQQELSGMDSLSVMIFVRDVSDLLEEEVSRLLHSVTPLYGFFIHPRIVDTDWFVITSRLCSDGGTVLHSVWGDHLE